MIHYNYYLVMIMKLMYCNNKLVNYNKKIRNLIN